MQLNNKEIGFITSLIKSGAGYHILKTEDKRGHFVQYEDQWFSRHILIIPSAIRDEEQTKTRLITI